MIPWQQAALNCLIEDNYSQAADLYQQAIEAEPTVKSYYWYLGLTLLLQGQEAEAQTTWMLGMMEGEAEEVEQWTTELIAILRSEAKRREALADYPIAWTIRQHLRELNPTDINNLLQVIQLSIKLETFTGEDLTSLGIIQLLESGQGLRSVFLPGNPPQPPLERGDNSVKVPFSEVRDNSVKVPLSKGDLGGSKSDREVCQYALDVDADLLLQVLQNVLDCALLHPLLPKFAEVCLPYCHKPQAFIHLLMVAATKMSYTASQSQPAIELAKLCLRIAPNDIELLSHLTTFYHYNAQYHQSIETAQWCCFQAKTLPDKVFAHGILLRELMATGGRWLEAFSIFEHYESLLLSLIEEQPTLTNQDSTSRLVNSAFVLPYFRDTPQTNRSIQNQVLQLCQAGTQGYAKELVERYHLGNSPQSRKGNVAKRLKIGYLSYCLGRHSVGWLARWLFKHHDPNQFQVHAYFINYQHLANDSLQDWFVAHVEQAHKFKDDCRQIAEQIYQDKIDILIDLDSITLDISCEVMALKPAPVQVSWLGWDASGIPTIDYFIADPYVLPESAQDYYTETIWRLPHTYIAVDGFEVGVPTLRREQLEIPSDAVVYLSAQTGYKRHPDTARLQMQIIKEVPNSYFLIKGIAGQESVKNLFIQIAEEEGVDRDRLRFLPKVALESVHRANLGIADVVLDTYPYNGATTTLETLWMCIPLVTRVGQQFSARNSYTMMMNAGITEGIAWTDEEYVEWGIRLGEDTVLRQQISWRLQQSRQTSPLWNAHKFTGEMEKAYQQMWERYV